jgi:hypothetical protein
MRLHCNLLDWNYLPFLFCMIALQSIRLELPPFLILCDCIAIYEIGVTSLLLQKGGNSNLIDCNAITQNIKGR